MLVLKKPMPFYSHKYDTMSFDMIDEINVQCKTIN